MTAKKWSQIEAAEQLRITTRQIRNLAAENVLTPDEAGRFAPLPTALAYLAHVQKDAAGRAARTELSKVEARRKTLWVRRHLGELVNLDELQRLSTDLWSMIWQAWTLATSHYYAHLSQLPGLSEADARRIAGSCDSLGKAELLALRDRWAARLRGEKVELRDDARIDAMLGALTEVADGEE